jgi:hypothetical protein
LGKGTLDRKEKTMHPLKRYSDLCIPAVVSYVFGHYIWPFMLFFISSN